MAHKLLPVWENIFKKVYGADHFLWLLVAVLAL